MIEIDKQRKQIPLFLLITVFLRSFFIQAVWSFERLLGFGLTYAILPAICYLHRDKAKRKLIIEEYLSCFNTHPYLAAPIIGVLISEEEKMLLLTHFDRGRIQNLKVQIMGPLGALGDTFFWATLRPFAALLGISLIFLFWDKNKFVALIGGLLSFFCVYNLFHVFIRFIGFFRGYHTGIQIVNTLKKINLQKTARIISALGLILIGGGVVFFSFSCSLFDIGGLMNLGSLIIP